MSERQKMQKMQNLIIDALADCYLARLATTHKETSADAKRTPRERLFAKIMRKFKRRQLRSGTGRKGEKGPIVTSREQAIAIAISETTRKYGPYIPKTARGLTPG